MEHKILAVLTGASCSCALTAQNVTLRGDYYRYDLHKRVKTSGTVTVDLLDVLRVGFTKTYSRRMLAIPMALGFLALLIKAIPAAEVSVEVIPEVWSVGHTFWSVPFQDTACTVCAVACLLTIPLYWLSKRDDLELNTIQGRYLLPRKGMDPARIAAFQQAFTQLKEARRKERKGA